LPLPPFPHTCCWHKANEQHAIMNHRDDICCHGGCRRCVRLKLDRPDGHGPFCPGRDFVIASEDPGAPQFPQPAR